MGYNDYAERCQDKLNCRKRLDLLTKDKRTQCLTIDHHFEAPEFSRWFKQKGKAFVRGTGENQTLWPFVALDMLPVIVRSSHNAECGNIGRTPWAHIKCARQTATGWDS